MKGLSSKKNGWTRTTLGSIIRPRRDKVLPSSDPSARYIGMEHVEAHSTRVLETAPAYTMRSSANRFYDGDVLYGRLRPYLNKVCKPGFSGLCSAEFIVFPKTEGIDPEFLKYRLNAADFAHFASHLNAGDRPRVDFDQLAEFEILLPPPDEQKRIVAEIEKQFTRLDVGVASLKRVQIALKRYRASVFKAACEGRLVSTEAELARKENRSYETGEELLQRIFKNRREKWNGKGKYKEPAAPDITNLPRLPKGWAWATLDQITEIKGGITKDQKRKHTLPARLVPYLRVANVQRGYLDLTEVKEIEATEDEIEELALKRGDLLFNEGGDRDKLGRGWVWNGEIKECIHQNHVFRARSIDIALNPKFISWYANSFGQHFFFAEGKHTTNLASISMTKLKRLPIPIPPSAEQQRIVEEMERTLSVIDELDELIAANLRRGTGLRQSVLRNAFKHSDHC
jgi:type I restriction enzyme, S subunit